MSLKQMQILDSTEAVKQERPAPCARHCEANAFKIVIKNLKAQLAQPEQPKVRTGDCLLVGVCASEGHKIQKAQPEQEPVIDKSAAIRIATSLGWTPQRKPLTHEQRFDVLTKFEPHKHEWHAPAILIDLVEAAHGIKENT